MDKKEIEEMEEMEETEKTEGEEDETLEISGIHLELGDIIELIAPTNSDYNQHVFFINYIDPKRIELLNVENYQLHHLTLDDSAMISDESITEINLLSRSEEKGFSRQKKLLPKTWIDVHFGGEVPTIITGEITNLEEDEIEIKTFPDNETIFINFEYQGIPENIPIEKIVIRDPPRAALLEKLQGQELSAESSDELLEQEATIVSDDFNEYTIHIPEQMTPEENFHEALQSVYLNANELFGEDLEDIFQVVEIPESEKKYSIDIQVNDFTDELLSTIPNIKRTQSVMNNIHRLVERFKQLRKFFSLTDENGNVIGKKIYGDTFKPIVQHILDLDVKLRWFIPVVQQNKKLYDLDENNVEEEEEELIDGFRIKNSVELTNQSQKSDDFYNNRIQGEENKYHYLLNSYNEFMKPFDSPPPTNREEFLVFNREIKTDLEAIVNNLSDFYSTTLGMNSRKKYSYCRYLIQKYNIGDSRISLSSMTAKNGIFVRQNKNNDKMTIKSFIMMPESVMKYSHIDLPSTNIMIKSNLSQISLNYFRFFKKKKEIRQKIILNLNQELDYEKEDNQTFLKEITEYILDDTFNNENDEEKYKKFLNVIFPKIRGLIRLIQNSIQGNKHAFIDVIKALEPFLIYPNDITYGQYNEIRYFIKEKIKEYKIRSNEKSQEYNSFKNTTFNTHPFINRILSSLSEKKEMEDIFLDSYTFDSLGSSGIDQINDAKPRLSFRSEGESSASLVGEYAKSSKNKSSSEILLKIIEKDNSLLYCNLLSFMLLSLITPDKIMDSLEKPVLDILNDENPSVKKNSCTRRFVAKKYNSIAELQKDNNVDSLYYDKDYDDTPYSIIKKYDNEKKTMLPEKFVSFLAENLVQRHDCPRSESLDVAKTLIAGKKIVQDGEYAVVVFKPSMIQGSDTSNELTEKEKKDIELEEQVKTYYHYYKRLSNNWIRDYDIDEEAFFDNNTLFCNIDFKCVKNPTVNTCDTTDWGEIRMKNATAKRALSEFDKRFSITVEELAKNLEKMIRKYTLLIKKNAIIQENTNYKSNFIAFEIGKFCSHSDALFSPYLKLYELILSQYDFPKKQLDICRFVHQYCREPLFKEHEESPHWLYCRETNTQLVPQSIYQLAHVFVSGGDYLLKMEELCHSIGELSDDGNSWTDKHCGCELRRIDYVNEEGYDESGFAVKSHAIIEKDLGTVVAESFATTNQSSSKKEKKIFEDETTNITYNVFHAICSQIDVPIDAIESFVLRVSMELITNNEIVLSEKSYQKRIEKIEKTKGKVQAPYKIYKNQTIITIVGGLILVAVQIVIPSLKIRKTFPGCVQSFSGFPMGGIEDTSGLQYIACVINKIKSSIYPWDSIEKLNAATLEKRMREVLDRYVIERADIVELFMKKKEFLILYPAQQQIDKEHSISKWRHFLPPIVEYTLTKAVQGTSYEFNKDFVDQIRKGSKDQYTSLCVYQSKKSLYGYGIIEAINHIVKSKGLLLKTMSKVPFLENACCNEGEWVHPITYFSKEDKNIDAYIKMSLKNEVILKNINNMTKANLLYYAENTAIQMPEIPRDFMTENIYSAFIHYCHFDVETPIPDDLEKICRDKPVGYNKLASLEEKIEFLKRNGKKYIPNDLNQLMKIVHQRTIFQIEPKTDKTNPILIFREYLEHLESKNSSIVEEPLRKLLFKLLKEYRPKVMNDEASKEQTPFNIAITRLRNYLIKTNEQMFQRIKSIIDNHGNLSNKKFDELQTVLLNITTWDLDRNIKNTKLYYDDGMFSVSQFIKNAIFSITKIYPHLILKNVEHLKVPKHWGLSEKHCRDIALFVSNQTDFLNKYKKNVVLTKWLENVATWEEEINLFIKYLPVNTSIEKEGMVFYDLFDKRTLYLLYTYCWYSVLYEFVDSSHDEDLIKMDIRERKNDRREEIKDNQDESNFIHTEAEMDENTAEIEDELMDVEILSGSKIELQKNACSLLLDFINIENQNKKTIDYPYKNISRRVHKTKEAEKKSITDFLQNMDKDERNIENMLRKYKMGRWNIGLQKGLSQYDKNIYDANRDQNISRLYDEFVETNELENAEQDSFDANELQEAEDRENALLADNEGNDISGLDEDYGNGNYYSEDIDRDFGYDD